MANDTAPKHEHAAVATALDADEQRQVEAFGRLAFQQRRNTSVSKASSRELRVMVYFAGGLMILMCALYVFLPNAHARLVTTYVADVAMVVSGWGIYRAMRSRSQQPKGGANMYALVFGMLTAFYAAMLLSLTHVFDKWVK